jgi:hypothetical protein
VKEEKSVVDAAAVASTPAAGKGERWSGSVQVCLFRTHDDSGIRIEVWLKTEGNWKLSSDTDHTWQSLHCLIHEEQREAGQSSAASPTAYWKLNAMEPAANTDVVDAAPTPKHLKDEP